MARSPSMACGSKTPPASCESKPHRWREECFGEGLVKAMALWEHAPDKAVKLALPRLRGAAEVELAGVPEALR